MSAPGSGYGLMQRADLLTQAYEASPVARDGQSWLQQLRKALGHARPGQYGGIGRYPLNADYTYALPGWQWSPEDAVDHDTIAMIRLREILGIVSGEFPQETWLIDGPWLVPSLDRAREIKQLSVCPEHFEILEVARHPNRTRSPSIGFDVGYWASGNFSLICDCTAWPLWHPPDTCDFEQLAASLRPLNARMLFETPDAAVSFRDFYCSRLWAEEESEQGGEFQIVEVAEVE